MATERANPTERHAQRGGVHHLHCHGPKCGNAFRAVAGADLHCSPKCRKDDEKHLERSAASLAARGFKRSTKAPNVFTKDGISITLEQVKVHGLKETIRLHADAAKS